MDRVRDAWLLACLVSLARCGIVDRPWQATDSADGVAAGGVPAVLREAALADFVVRKVGPEGDEDALLRQLRSVKHAKESASGLFVHEDNARAQGLYLSRGFEREGRVRNAVRIDGKYYDQVMMGMEVA